jgi:hypothetical protein
MSIENKIENLTEAVKALTEAVLRVSITKALLSDAAPYYDTPSLDKVVDETPEAPVAEPKKPKAEKPKAAKAEKAEKPKDEVTYEDISTAFVNYMKKNGRDAALAILAKYDVDNLKLVDKRNWNDILADVSDLT